MVGADTASGWTVNLRGSHPDSGNDDCWTGEDGLDEAQARAIYAEPSLAPHDLTGWHSTIRGDSTLWIEIVGPGMDEARQIRASGKSVDDDSDWKREIAMQAGMGLGVDAYNDAMGV